MHDPLLPGDGRHTRLRAVSRERPCPVCGGQHKCSRGEDGLIVCGRAAGTVLGYRHLGPCRGDPQFHLYRPDDAPPRPVRSRPDAGRPDLHARAAACAAALTAPARTELAELLGLPESVLALLPELGWLPHDPAGPCWVFPEVDGAGRLVGLVRRYRDGAKRALPGSRRGLTVPQGWRDRPGPVFCPEGASDTLALAALGLAAVGRPAAGSGADDLADFLRTLPADRPLLVVGDFDPRPDGTWPGRDGARRAAGLLTRALGRSVLWTLPPAGSKDVRAWVREQHLDLTLADAWSDAGERLAALLGTQTHLADPEAPAAEGTVADREPWEPPVPLSQLPGGGPFPVHVLPAAVEDFVHAVATALGCPVDFVTVPLLVLAGAAIGASRSLEVKPGWWERPCLYAAVVGRPGSAKSPALKTVAAPVYHEQHQLKVRFDRDYALYEEARQAHEAQARRREGASGARPVPPVLPRLYASDATVESLAPLLQANPRGLVLIRDELVAVVTGLNQYKAGRGSDRQFYLSAWAGEPSCVDRRQQAQGPLLVPHPFLAVVGGLPPDLLGCLRDRRGAADGFLDRFLFAYPDLPDAPPWSWEGIPERLTQAWADTLAALRRLEPEPGPEGAPRPRVVHLGAGGREAWRAFAEGLAGEMADPDFPGYLRDPWSKLRGYGARLALIVHLLHTLDRPEGDGVVEAADVERAAALVAYFQGQARRVWAAMSADPQAQAAQEVLDWLTARPGLAAFTRTGLHGHLRYRQHFAQARSLDLPLQILERHGYLRRLAPLDHPGPGRKPSDRFVVNPLWRRP